MATEFMRIEDEASWLEKRKGYVTSTQMAALFGLSKYNTAFELYHISRGNIEAEIKENNFMKFGKIIEAPICEMIKIEHPDWIINDYPYFAYDEKDKIGSSFDRVVEIDGKSYLLEIKSISYSEYKENFTEHSADDIEALPQYEVQMHMEMELTKDSGFDGVVMAIFILDTRTLRYIFRKYDPEVGAELRSAAREFWALTEWPTPDYLRDKSIISRVCPEIDPEFQLDATKDNRITELAAQYKASKDLIKQEEAAADAAYAEITVLVGKAKYAWTNDYKITISDIKPNEGKPITQDMVGTIVGARNGYKKLTITETKKKDK